MKKASIIGLMGWCMLFFVPAARAASCPLDSVLTFDIDSILTEVTIYEYGDVKTTTVWTVNPDGSRIGKSKIEEYTTTLKEFKATYAWDNTLHDWTGTDKYEYIYKYFGGLKLTIMNTTFAWINKAWVADKRETYNFDASAREIEYIESKRNTSTNELVPVKGHEYTWLDDTQKLLEIEYTAYGTIAWKTGTKKEWNFDAEGRQTLYAYSTMTNGTWVGSSKETWAFEGPEGQLTLHEKYGWYNSDWSMTLREKAVFDAAGHQTLEEKYTGSNGVETGVTKEETTYDGDIKTMIVNYKWSSGAWVGDTKETWEYNGPAGQLTLHEKFGWASTDWSRTLKEETEYAGSKIIRKENMTYTNGVTSGTKETWEFTSGKETLHEKFTWASSTWSKTLREETEYSGSNVIRIENYAYANGVTTGTAKVLTTFTNGKKTQILSYAWENGAWKESTMETWSFNASGLPTLHMKREWENDDWTTMVQENTYYSGGTTKIGIENFEMIAGVWTGTKKEEYSYTGGKQTETIVYKWELGDWLKSDRETWAYTSNKLTLHEKFGWNGAEWIKTISEKSGYDAAGNQTLVENYALLTTTGWTGTKKEEYTFEGGKKTTTIIYAWADNDWIKSTKNEIGYQDGNTEVSEANYTWKNDTWTGSGNRTYTTKDGENRVVELLTKNWPDGATEWTNASIATHKFNADGEDILTYNGTWNGSRWKVSSMTRLDFIFDEADRQLLKASWQCAADSIWKGIEKDTAKYSATGKIVYKAKYKGWKNDDWIPVSKTENTYNSDDKPILEESYSWLSNKWQGTYRYEYEYDGQGRQITYATYKGWNTSTNWWKGNSKQSFVYYLNYTDKYESKTTYNWKNNQWSPVFSYQYTYDESGREIEQIVRSYSSNTWKNKTKYVKEYSGSKLVGEYEYAWSNNQWSIRSQKTLYYDEDAQAKLRREIIGSWTSSGLTSYSDRHYVYACDAFLIRYVNYDGMELATQNLPKNANPAYPGSDTPTKPEDDEFTYTFIGWTPELHPVVGPATYVATYKTTTNAYTITWLNDDGSLIDNTTVDYGVVPTHAEPTKAPDAQYTYYFDGWTPEVVSVTGDATYTATYRTTVNEYTVTFRDEDGSVLKSQDWPYGETPTCDNPSKAADVQYTYTFAGWDKEIVPVNGEATYTATYTGTVNEYTVTFKDEDESVLKSQDWPFGETPTCDEPTKPATAQYTYTFAAWKPAVIPVNGTAEYTATYDSVVNEYLITFKDEDGTVLKSQKWPYGETPTCDEPTKAADVQYTYTFAGWDHDIVAVTGEETYTATYTSTVNEYTIIFKDEDGSVLLSKDWPFGEMPSCDDPTKPATAQYTFTFEGWTPEIIAVNGTATYMATYSSTVNEYTITFRDRNGSVLKRQDWPYGEMPSCDEPSKAPDAQYTYTFAGWDKEVVEVKEAAVYTATYTETLNAYTITFTDEDGSVLKSQDWFYGETPSCDEPTKDATAQYTFTFAGWDKTVVAVVGTADYKATYTQTVNEYTVTFRDEDGSVLKSQDWRYGDTPSCPEPTKAATDQYFYTFAGWDKTIVPVTDNAEYKATYNQTLNSYTITFKNDDGSVLNSQAWRFGETPSCTKPTKESTAEYTYTFAGWDKKIEPVDKDAEYKATYTATKRKYTITWKNDNGTVINKTTVEYGVTPTHADVYKKNTIAYTYTFTGWTPAIVPVTGNAEYTATFSAAINQYTITFKNENGKELQSSKVDYGATPEYTGKTPTKAAEAVYTYAFAGWSPQIVPVAGDATYTAIFDKIMNTYSIVFVDEDGKTVLDEVITEHGQKPTTEVVPTKPEDDDYIYTFDGWTPKITVAVRNATYKATYTATRKGLELDLPTTKVMIDHVVYLKRGDQLFTIQGQLVQP